MSDIGILRQLPNADIQHKGRKRAWKISSGARKISSGELLFGTSEEKRDEKLDRFIAEQSAAYPNCLMSSRPPQKGKPKLDPLHLTRDEFDAIAAGKMSP
jgi:hypothetical protein